MQHILCVSQISMNVHTTDAICASQKPTALTLSEVTIVHVGLDSMDPDTIVTVKQR